MEKFEIKKELENLVNCSRIAQKEIESKSNKFVKNLLNKIALKILEKKINFHLSSLAVRETKFGNIEDKIKKKILTKQIIFLMI